MWKWRVSVSPWCGFFGQEIPKSGGPTVVNAVVFASFSWAFPPSLRIMFSQTLAVLDGSGVSFPACCDLSLCVLFLSRGGALLSTKAQLSVVLILFCLQLRRCWMFLCFILRLSRTGPTYDYRELAPFEFSLLAILVTSFCQYLCGFSRLTVNGCISSSVSWILHRVLLESNQINECWRLLTLSISWY